MVLLSDGKEQNMGKLLYEEILRRGEEATYVSLEDKNIRPCMACGSCSGQSYGRCVIEDDMQEILGILANDRCWVIVCPVRFGGYSSTAKMVQDRTVTLGDPRYYVARGELVKGMLQGGGILHTVGIKDDCSEKEREAFCSLHRENVHIMNVAGESFVVASNPSQKEISRIAEVLIHGK